MEDEFQADNLTPTLSEFEISSDASLIIQNWPYSRLFSNIFMEAQSILK